jgi:hypothetical protein
MKRTRLKTGLKLYSNVILNNKDLIKKTPADKIFTG